MTRIAFIAALGLGALVAACSPQGPLRTFTKGEELAFYDFNNSSEFEQGVYETASLLIRDGVYRIDVRTGNNELWWGQWGDAYDNVVIDVDADQQSEPNENAYGIMCRARGRVGMAAVNAASGFPTDEAVAEMIASMEATVAPTPTERATEAATEDAATESATIEAATTAEATDGEATASASAETTRAADSTEEAEATEAAAVEARPQPTQAQATATQATDMQAESQPDATLEQQPEREQTAEANLRATELVASAANGDSYLFLIQGSGSAGIFRARGRDLQPLADWRTSDAIRVGPAQNHLRAVCVGNYLAFYVNDALVADATDDAYTGGQVGLAASAANRLGVRVEFDNLTVSQATTGG